MSCLTTDARGEKLNISIWCENVFSNQLWAPAFASDCPAWQKTPSGRTLSLVWSCWRPSFLLPATGSVRAPTSPSSLASSHSPNQKVKARLLLTQHERTTDLHRGAFFWSRADLLSTIFPSFISPLFFFPSRSRLWHPPLHLSRQFLE